MCASDVAGECCQRALRRIGVFLADGSGKYYEISTCWGLARVWRSDNSESTVLEAETADLRTDASIRSGCRNLQVDVL